MKNKKLLTRLFVLLASLVLVFALALPCFADVTPSLQKVLVDYTITNLTDLRTFYAQYRDKIVSASCIYNKNNLDYKIVFSNFEMVETYMYASCSIEVSNSNITGRASNRIYYFWFNNGINSQSFEFGTLKYTVNSDGVSSFEALRPVMITSDAFTIPFTFTVLEEIPADDGDSDTTASSDMYSNLFNILKDAVYGSDAELTGSQEYALTLISTILTYATILLPVIIVIFIAVWCFKRF